MMRELSVSAQFGGALAQLFRLFAERLHLVSHILAVQIGDLLGIFRLRQSLRELEGGGEIPLGIADRQFAHFADAGLRACRPVLRCAGSLVW